MRSAQISILAPKLVISSNFFRGVPDKFSALNRVFLAKINNWVGIYHTGSFFFLISVYVLCNRSSKNDCSDRCEETWWAVWLMLFNKQNGNDSTIKSSLKSDIFFMCVCVGVQHLAQGHFGRTFRYNPVTFQITRLSLFKVQATLLPYFPQNPSSEDLLCLSGRWMESLW